MLSWLLETALIVPAGTTTITSRGTVQLSGAGSLVIQSEANQCVSWYVCVTVVCLHWVFDLMALD